MTPAARARARFRAKPIGVLGRGMGYLPELDFFWPRRGIAVYLSGPAGDLPAPTPAHPQGD